VPASDNIAVSFVASLGRVAIQTILEMGRIALFFLNSLIKTFSPPYSLKRLLEQIHFIGMKSLFVVSLTGLFTGMVLGLHGYYTLSRVGSEGLLGAAVALTLIRELGPVLAALMLTGRAGSSIAAEIGIMRISEQIDALDTMDINPVRFLVAPRVAASIICFPLLAAVFDVIGIIGGYLTGVCLLGVNSGIYIAKMEAFVDMKDVREGFIKAFVFSLIVSIVCCYQGYTTHKRKGGFGARGVGESTTTAVVMSSVLILVVDYVVGTFLL